jgi:hypothetical protein
MGLQPIAERAGAIATGCAPRAAAPPRCQQGLCGKAGRNTGSDAFGGQHFSRMGEHRDEMLAVSQTVRSFSASATGASRTEHLLIGNNDR